MHFYFTDVAFYYVKTTMFWGTSSPDSLPKFDRWTPLGDFRPRTAVHGVQKLFKLNYGMRN